METDNTSSSELQTPEHRPPQKRPYLFGSYAAMGAFHARTGVGEYAREDPLFCDAVTGAYAEYRSAYRAALGHYPSRKVYRGGYGDDASH